jgi:hypothetical protein
MINDINDHYNGRRQYGSIDLIRRRRLLSASRLGAVLVGSLPPS